MNRLILLAILAISIRVHADQPEDKTPLSRIAFGSCHKLDRPETIWDIMRARNPQMFIFLGDTIYKDTVIMDEKKAEYAKLAAVPSYARFKAACPIIATWDDHDYGANDGGADYPMKEEAKNIFLDFFEEPKDSPRWKHPGVYHSQTFGPDGKRVQVILLDMRSFRSPPIRALTGGGYLPNDDPKATELGDEQWKWLAEQLKVPAQIRLIVSSIQVEHEDHANEKWANFPKEREKLFKLIADSKASGVIFISGDRHHGEISCMDIGAGYPVIDITSSGLNCPYEAWDEPNRHREGKILWADNFGMVQIDWTAADPQVEVEIRDGKGEVALSKRVKLSQLQKSTKP